MGLHRTYLPNGFWVNTVLVPHNAPGGRFHTVVCPREGLWAPVAELRSARPDEWPNDHFAAVAWARDQPRWQPPAKRRAA